MKKKKNILIRCDASQEIGMGHIIRCIELAKQFVDCNILFAIRDNDITISQLQKNNFNYVIIEQGSYHEQMIKIVKDNGIDIFIGDIRDGLPEKTIIEMKVLGILTVAIDEPSDYRKKCDLCFFPPVPQIDKLDWDGFNGKIYKGWEYIILRNEFYKKFNKLKNKTPNVLIMLGGTDAHNLTLKSLKSVVEKNKEEFNVYVVVRNSHKEICEIRKYAEESEKNISIYSNVENMANFLEKIDYAIIAFGVTAYELLTRKVKAVHICADDDALESSSIFDSANYAKRITISDEIPKLEILKRLETTNVIEKNKIAECILNEN